MEIARLAASYLLLTTIVRRYPGAVCAELASRHPTHVIARYVARNGSTLRATPLSCVTTTWTIAPAASLTCVETDCCVSFKAPTPGSSLVAYSLTAMLSSTLQSAGSWLMQMPAKRNPVALAAQRTPASIAYTPAIGAVSLSGAAGLNRPAVS